MGSSRSFATATSPAASAANPSGCTFVARVLTTRDLADALDGIRTVFIAVGSIGIEGVLQRIAINAAAGPRTRYRTVVRYARSLPDGRGASPRRTISRHGSSVFPLCGSFGSPLIIASSGIGVTSR